MTARSSNFATCPFQPVPPPAERPSVLSAPSVFGDPVGAARIPSNACTEDHCRLWMRAFDGSGRLVGAYCAFAGLVAGVGQLCAFAAQLAGQGASGEMASPGNAKPTA